MALGGSKPVAVPFQVRGWSRRRRVGLTRAPPALAGPVHICELCEVHSERSLAWLKTAIKCPNMSVGTRGEEGREGVCRELAHSYRVHIGRYASQLCFEEVVSYAHNFLLFDNRCAVWDNFLQIRGSADLSLKGSRPNPFPFSQGCRTRGGNYG